LAIAAYWVPATALAGIDQNTRAEIHGNIVSADGLTGVAGVSVWAANMATSEIYTSTATAADGSYTLKDLPPGEYDLAVETTDGLLPADALVQTAPGKSTIVSIALKAVAADDEDENKPGEGEKGEEPKADEGQGQENPETPEEPEPQQKKKKKKGGGFFRSPAGATILIVIGAGAVAAVASSATDNNNEPPMTGSGN